MTAPKNKVLSGMTGDRASSNSGAQFTPGPWAIEDGEFHAYINAGAGIEVALVPESSKQVPDARLIAAAPELYEALRAVIGKVVAEDNCYDDGQLVVDFEIAERAHDEVAVALDAARVALKKAEL